MNDDALEAALYANRRSKRGHRRVEEPDWANVHRELKRKHVTLTILWDEYIAENPGGYRYSRFCELHPQNVVQAVDDDRRSDDDESIRHCVKPR
jgi:transposase